MFICFGFDVEAESEAGKQGYNPLDITELPCSHDDEMRQKMRQAKLATVNETVQKHPNSLFNSGYEKNHYDQVRQKARQSREVKKKKPLFFPLLMFSPYTPFLISPYFSQKEKGKKKKPYKEKSLSLPYRTQKGRKRKKLREKRKRRVELF